MGSPDGWVDREEKAEVSGRRILLTGASGLLGRTIAPLLSSEGRLESPGLERFDLKRVETIHETVAAVRPDLVVHLAAETRVDVCETEPAEAYRVNTLGTIHLAEACRRAGARLVMMSTDYVFDGKSREPYREHQPTAPCNRYGRSKEEAERACRTIVADSLVVRSSSLFGGPGPHFVASIRRAVREGRPLRVVDDQIQSPTWVGHLAPPLARAALGDLHGILHLSAEGECSWFAFARAILEEEGIEAECTPISSRASGRAAPRPAYSVLDGELALSFGLELPDWREGLRRHLEETG
ncbi:MAG: dTDP-4-dehydrorhamnose reductase [Candidatus Eisenbacteria bacterium]|nr:dTDP-4-dehydrorhamnose reductase [Candidatus Latescibacterota bacterium]MBD3301093.1 dTDP-4-dehydrorhamnose reductase [Candidatus Eisenbacteria bacterium]